MPHQQTRRTGVKDANPPQGRPGVTALLEVPGMQQPEQQEIDAALYMLRRGAPEALEGLLPLVYNELRSIAHRQLASEAVGHTLNTTALVHETYLKLKDQVRAEWVDREQFFAIAARVMRRILVDYARKHWALRRGGPGRRALPFDEAEQAGLLAVAERASELLALDEALERLTALDARLGQVVECRFFGGLSEEETARALGISQRTVSRDWSMAKGWLHGELRDDAS
jgi:RNA polymerase sigma factor (TIGR02999 family)